jgi:hypothetical protein
MGVRKDDPALCDELNAVLTQNRAAIDKILDDFGVPRVGPATTPPPTPVAKGG